LAQPSITFALGLLVAGAVAITSGVVGSWRSQARSRALIKSHQGGLVVVPCDEMFAFTAGFLRPKVVASSSLLNSAPSEWREVVLAHEEAHRRGRHTLLLLIVESFARGLPLRPVRRGVEAFRLALEMTADESASRAVGSRELVAETVAGIALTPSAAGVGFEGDAVRRVQRLIAPERARLPFGLLLPAAVIGVLAFTGGHAVHCGDAALQSLRAEGCRVHLAGPSASMR
ncbi:MAG: M56 family metallopeptidase, partial [Anaerolineales bacterium]